MSSTTWAARCGSAPCARPASTATRPCKAPVKSKPARAINSSTPHRNQAAFMGEAGAVATYDVTCHLSFRASCQAMWIEGVALAPEQIGATDFTDGIAGDRHPRRHLLLRRRPRHGTEVLTAARIQDSLRALVIGAAVALPPVSCSLSWQLRLPAPFFVHCGGSLCCGSAVRTAPP